MPRRSTHPRRFLTSDEAAQVEAAIKEAESQTSGQIKVVLVRHCWLSLRRKAQKLFTKFGLDRTSRHNCVMIVLVASNREFLVYGDRGIHGHVGSEFWRDIRSAMQARFRSGEFAAGLCDGVREIGRQLAEHYPREEGRNELPDQIEYA